jgi:hypothetical protein
VTVSINRWDQSITVTPFLYVHGDAYHLERSVMDSDAVIIEGCHYTGDDIDVSAEGFWSLALDPRGLDAL